MPIYCFEESAQGYISTLLWFSNFGSPFPTDECNEQIAHPLSDGLFGAARFELLDNLGTLHKASLRVS